MKKLLSVGFVMVTAFFLICVPGLTSGRAQGSVSLQVFYDELQPYGTWMQHNQYGYVWTPRVDRGFTPYATNGYWINTEYGNTWVSDYSWGWAPFHYGRWFYDDFYGWMWVPDTMWAPAWVAWRSGGGYYGWAPLMPGYGYSVSYNYYNRIPHHYWSFVPYRYITYRTLHQHCVPRPHVVNIINHTTIVTNNYTDSRRRTTYFTGPSRREIEGTTRQRVDVYSISDRNAPGRTEVERGRVSFYKPDIDNSNDTRTQSMPSRFMREDGKGKLEQVEASRERSYQSRDQRRIENDLPNSIDRSIERNESGREDQKLTIDKMERMQQMERQRDDDAFKRFERERENPVRESERNMNEDQRRQQLNRKEDVLPQQRNTERQRNEDVMERFERQRENPVREQERNMNQDVRRQQLNRNEDVLQEQRNIPRQRENAVRDEQQRSYNESIRRQQSERQSPQRQFSQPDNEVRRSPQREPQSFQRMERQNPSRSSQPNTTFERQRSSPSHDQQIRRSTLDQRSSPSRNSGSNENSPRKRN